jgi:lysophospholipase L1-like esterase
MNAFSSRSKTAPRLGWPRRLARDGAPWLACASLLAISAIQPETDLIRVAKGKSRLGREMRHVDTGGYYEHLIDKGRLAEADPSGEDQPPPGWVPSGASGIVEYAPGYLRWRMKPNLDIVWNGAPFHTNSRGYRTPEVSLDKPAGVYRIVVIGSSNTMGHGVADGEAYPRLLEDWLRSLPGLGRKVEVVNLAVSGDSPSRRLLRMALEAESYHPDWILCDASILDPSLEERHLETVLRSSPPPEIPLGYVAAAIRRSKVSAADSPEEFQRKIRFELKALLDGAYEGWSDYSTRTGLPLSVVILPRADDKRDNPVMKKLMHGYARRHRLDCFDLGDAFGDLSIDEFRVSPWDKHPSVKGHRLIFEALRDAIAARGELPGLPLPD